MDIWVHSLLWINCQWTTLQMWRIKVTPDNAYAVYFAFCFGDIYQCWINTKWWVYLLNLILITVKQLDRGGCIIIIPPWMVQIVTCSLKYIVICNIHMEKWMRDSKQQFVEAHMALDLNDNIVVNTHLTFIHFCCL